ncbi:MAG: hypothetical protein AAF747_05780 [Planctomycetota bacterium]
MRAHDSNTPPELRDIEASLDRLADADRDATPRELAGRIAEATSPALANSSASPLPFRRIAIVASGLAAAAALALLVTVGLQPSQPAASSDHTIADGSADADELDSWDTQWEALDIALGFDNSFDAELAQLATSIGDASAGTVSLQSSVEEWLTADDNIAGAG